MRRRRGSSGTRPSTPRGESPRAPAGAPPEVGIAWRHRACPRPASRGTRSSGARSGACARPERRTKERGCCPRGLGRDCVDTRARARQRRTVGGRQGAPERRGRAHRQVGELLSVIVTPAPLDGLQIGAQAQRLPAERVALWEKSWGTQTGRMELSEGAGKVWTKEEKEAGASGGRLLKASAPGPQTLYYRPGVKPDEPLLIKVQLQYSRRSVPAPPRR